MTYTIYINKKSYEVSRKIYICHCTRQINNLHPQEFYTDFILNFEFKENQDALDYMHMYIGHNKILKSHSLRMHGALTASRRSLVSLANLAEYLNIRSIEELEKEGSCIATMKMMDSSYNYPNLEFKTDYKKLDPWLSFYHSLIYGIKDDLPYQRTILYPKDINTTLKHLGFNFKYKDIKEDLLMHMALIEKDGVIYWADKFFADWLWEVHSNRIYLYNYYKITSKIAKSNIRY